MSDFRMLLAAVVFSAGAASAPVGALQGATQQQRAIAVEPQLPRVARSSDGMVVTGSAFATDAAARVLAQGGNAIDAAVTAAFVLGVVEPSMSGIGGRTQMVIRTSDGQFHGVDGATQVPARFPGGDVRGEETYGYDAVAIPGTVAALATAAERYGSWPLARLIQPALTLAEEGFILPEAEATRIASVRAQLSEFSGSRAYFLRPDGTSYKPGDRFRQPDLARTLRRIAERGVAGFYTGETARLIEQDMVARGGHLRATDLAAYKVHESLIVKGNYRGHEMVGTYLPASAATTIGALQILGHFDVADAGSARWAELVRQSLLFAFNDRDSIMTSPNSKAAWLTSTSLAQTRAQQMRDPLRRTSNNPLPAAASDNEPEHTTHLSVADRDGQLVALTQSVGPMMGSRVAAPGLGFIYAATMGYLGSTSAGDRPYSSQSPMFVLKDGQPLMILGAAGARRIISAIVQTASRVMDQKIPLDSAMVLPRFHPTGNIAYMETRTGSSWSPAALDSLKTWGVDVRTRDDAPYFARINAIAWDQVAKVWVGVADPRWQGAASGPRR